jgi:hypothetical protein
VEYLGHVIYPGGLGMQQIKVQAIARILRPTDVSKVCDFMHGIGELLSQVCQRL